MNKVNYSPDADCPEMYNVNEGFVVGLFAVNLTYFSIPLCQPIDCVTGKFFQLIIHAWSGGSIQGVREASFETSFEKVENASHEMFPISDRLRVCGF